MGAYHALQLALTRADLFPVALCLSGNYDPSTWHAWGERGDAAYFTNPTDYVSGLHGPHLDWLRSRLHVVLVVGQGAWEVHPTQALPSTHRMAGLLRDKASPRARRVGPRRRPRLALVAAPTRASPGPVLLRRAARAAVTYGRSSPASVSRSRSLASGTDTSPETTCASSRGASERTDSDCRRASSSDACVRAHSQETC